MHRQIAGRLTGPVTKWIVLVLWFVAFAVSLALAGKLGSVQDNQASSWLPASAESTQALNKLQPFYDQNDIPTIVVYEKDAGLTPADLGTIKTQAAKMQQLEGVTGKVVGPLPSQDGKAAQVVITFNFGKNGWNKLPDAADQLHAIAALPGAQVHLAGPGGQAADSADAFAGLDGTLLFATLGVVILILLFTYRSPILWVLPLLSSVVALMASEAVIYLLAKYAGLTVNGQSQGILTVLVIGAGTDYALLLVARYREELRNYEDRHEAMAHALHRAAPAILASAATVVVGMLCLLFAEMNSTKGLGPVNAIGVAVTFLVMTTLLPALLVIFGRWVFWPRRPAYGSPEPTSTGLWAKVGRAIAPRPRKVWVITTAVLLVACLGMFKLDAHGLSSDDQYTKELDSIKGQAILAAHDMVSTADPIRVVANADHAQQVEAAVAKVPGLEPGDRPATKDGVVVVSAVAPGDVAGQAAFDKVREIRAAVGGIPGADALVGGTSALYLDIQHASDHDTKTIIPIVLVVVLLILMILLRALAAPLILMGTVILSFGAALGLSTLLFHYVFANVISHGDGFNGADASFPLFVFVFLVALGIDYNIFLMTRVREETATRGTRAGSLVALSSTGGVITSAGLVLASTFAVLGTIPLVFLAEMGTAVALGVLLDTMIVRSVLVTAINLDLGSKIWWPSKLDSGATEPGVEPAGEAVGAPS